MLALLHGGRSRTSNSPSKGISDVASMSLTGTGLASEIWSKEVMVKSYKEWLVMLEQEKLQSIRAQLLDPFLPSTRKHMVMATLTDGTEKLEVQTAVVPLPTSMLSKREQHNLELQVGRARLEQFKRIDTMEGWVKDGFITLDLSSASIVKATIAGTTFKEPVNEFPSEQFVASAFLLVSAGQANEKDYTKSDRLYTWKDYR